MTVNSPSLSTHPGKSPPRIAILHYASPPGIGGVESTIAHHAQGLATLGYPVRVISGAGASFNPHVETIIHPLFGSRDPQILAVKHELDHGITSSAFDALVNDIEALLRQALDGCEVCIVHNIHTMNKNLALTAALHRLAEPHMIAWCHDLAWTNPLYHDELRGGYPWTLLSQAWPNTRYVTISQSRQTELAALMQIPIETIPVLTPGIDVAQFLQWTPTTRFLEEKLHLLDADKILLLPARLTRRKNISLALQVIAELRRISTEDYRLIVTGPPGSHNPTNLGYFGELLAIRTGLGLENVVHFLYDLSHPPLIPDDPTMSNLYQLADGLFFPSLQEGFGIPIIEAGIIGLPVFCSDLPPFRESGHEDVVFFAPEHDQPEQIAALIHNYFADNPRQRLKTRVRHHYRWDVIIRQHLVPLLEEHK
jgi:glycosyltransferase involved in cell wall biosynthesis